MDAREWKSADRPPSGNAPVLVAYNAMWKPSRQKHWAVLIARFSGGQWRFLNKKDKTRRPERIRFWMPLPKPPVSRPDGESHE